MVHELNRLWIQADHRLATLPGRRLSLPQSDEDNSFKEESPQSWASIAALSMTDHTCTIFRSLNS
jgi:hypothetical protein